MPTKQQIDVLCEKLLKFAATMSDRLKLRRRNGQPTLLSNVAISNKSVLWLTFSNGGVQQDLTIPLPVGTDGKDSIITQGHVSRAVGSWLIKEKEKSYLELVEWLLTEPVNDFFPTSSRKPYLERLLQSFDFHASALVFRGCQRIIDEIVNKLPLVGTDMQIWAMCNRIQILDPVWDSLTPKQALAYQRNVNLKFFPWSSLGLSDSGMCNNNLLKVDVRKTIPFGSSHHNPRRNLYQTLGMVGDDKPLVMSRTERNLVKEGIVRKGWNLMTAFVDMPLNFEDQIIVSKRLAALSVEESRSFTSFGKALVAPQDRVFEKHPLSFEPDGSIIRFTIPNDGAWISSIEPTKINFNGSKKDATLITVSFKRNFKEGFKITNRHGNKGVIVLEDTGVVHDPVHGDVPIDIIVSAKSVQKRKNFGQLLEAITTRIYGNKKRLIVKDNYVAHTDKVKKSLVASGQSEDGTVAISTKWGNFKAVAGWVHWGCIKTPEDQIWDWKDTRRTNVQEIRNAGNKVSHIEFKALMTMFGPKNAIVKEILEHMQGYDVVNEYLGILDTLRGQYPTCPEFDYEDIPVVDQSAGFFHDMIDFSGTVADETVRQGQFFIRLPDTIKYVINGKDNAFHERACTVDELDGDTRGLIIMDKILVPAIKMRRPWRHQSGKYGLTDIAGNINSILVSLHKYKSGEENLGALSRNIYRYFHSISNALSTKTGAINSHCMSVRYPWTVKATARTTDRLEKNEIEIHENMARDLKVKDGDIVLVERFPCLGFMSIRAQKVRITDDPMAKFVIRVSGNSLASLTLDFDGDVLYLMSFKSPQAKELLQKEFASPHPDRQRAFEAACSRKVPEFKEMSLDEFGIEIFPPIAAEQNADIVEGLTGIKRGTGTIIALCYNLMRILESSIGYSNKEESIALELLLDKVANSVFSKKHAGSSLENECREAICTANVEKMINLGFGEKASNRLAIIIKQLTLEVGLNPNNLEQYFAFAESCGSSTIVNKIVREQHKVWFASRADLHPIALLEHLEAKPNDLASCLFMYAMKKANGAISNISAEGSK